MNAFVGLRDFAFDGKMAREFAAVDVIAVI